MTDFVESVNELRKNVASFTMLSTLKNLVSDPKRMGMVMLVLWIHGKLTKQPLIRYANQRLVVFFPMVVYDVSARLSWFTNYLLNQLPKLQPSCPDWGCDKSLEPASLKTLPDACSAEALDSLREQVLRGKDMRYSEKSIVQLFDTLEPASCEMMTGRSWNGRIVRTTSVLDLADMLLVRPLGYLGFKWGKRYRTKYVGDPLLVRWLNKFYFPLPVWGNVSMDLMDYRGKTQATMRYSHQPWNDYFRVLDDGTRSGKIVVLGVWTAREKNGGWFTLSHSPEVIT